MKIANMICSCGKRSMDTPPILDVEKVLQDFAWKDFKEKTGPVEKIFLRRREYEIDVPMNYFHFDDGETVLKQRESMPMPTSSVGQTHSGTSVLSTHFRNNTNVSQTYRFRIERTRKATLSVTFQRGFCVGGKAQFKLRLPNVFGESSEIDMRLRISKVAGETFDETLTFEANSDINVEENCNYTANVAFTEKEICAEFMVQTLMRMPSGTAPVFIRRKRDHELQATVFINDLKDVFSDHGTLATPVEETSKDGRMVRHAIKFITTGIVEGMRLSGQTIYLDSAKIRKRDIPESGSMIQSASALVAEVVGQVGLFDGMIPSKSGAHREEATTAESVTGNQPETRIIKAPNIPTIITTAPSSQETSAPSDTGTTTSLDSQSIPDKTEYKTNGTSPPCPKPPSKQAVSGAHSRQSSAEKDDSSQPPPRRPPSNVAPNCRPPSRRNSRDADSTSRPPSRQSSRDVEHSGRHLSKQHSREADSMSRSSSRQSSRDCESMSRQASSESKSMSRNPSKQTSSDVESVSHRPLSRQSSRETESSIRSLTKQISTDTKTKPKPFRQTSRDLESGTHPPTKQTSRGKDKPTLKQTRSLSRGSKDESVLSSYKDSVRTQKTQFVKQESVKKIDGCKDALDTPRITSDSHKVKIKPDPLTIQTVEHLIKPTSSQVEISDADQKLLVESERPYIRRCFKHDTLERLERVSSLSEKPRIVHRSGSLPRSPQPYSPPHSIEAQSSEEDSTTSLSKLAKCTSV